MATSPAQRLVAARITLTGAVVISITVSLVLRGTIHFPPLSLSAALTVLMVFVLARIFEVGTRMRTELQGTI